MIERSADDEYSRKLQAKMEWQLSNPHTVSLPSKVGLSEHTQVSFPQKVTVCPLPHGSRALIGPLSAAYHTPKARPSLNSSLSLLCLLLTAESVGLAALMALGNGCDYTLCILFPVPAFQPSSTLCLDKTQRAA